MNLFPRMLHRLVLERSNWFDNFSGTEYLTRIWEPQTSIQNNDLNHYLKLESLFAKLFGKKVHEQEEDGDTVELIGGRGVIISAKEEGLIVIMLIPRPDHGLLSEIQCVWGVCVARSNKSDVLSPRLNLCIPLMRFPDDCMNLDCCLAKLSRNVFICMIWYDAFSNKYLQFWGGVRIFSQYIINIYIACSIAILITPEHHAHPERPYLLYQPFEKRA